MNYVQVVLQILQGSPSVGGGEPVEPVYDGEYYVAMNGTGTGFIESDPMSPADFRLVTVQTSDQILFKKGDVF